MKDLIIVGSGEFAQIAYEYFTVDAGRKIRAFSVEQEYLTEPELFGIPVIPYEKLFDLYPPANFEVFVAIPSSQLNRLRTRFYRELKGAGYSFATYISSRAFVWRNAVIGENTFIFENNVIQPFVSVGNNCVLWSGNHIGHRSVIEDNVFMASHAVVSGYCVIGAFSFIGVNATINDHVKIAPNCIIGSGALITKDTDADKVYAGSAARAVPGRSSADAGL